MFILLLVWGVMSIYCIYVWVGSKKKPSIHEMNPPKGVKRNLFKNNEQTLTYIIFFSSQSYSYGNF